MSATRIYKVCEGFHMKIPLYQWFHTFFGLFHTFISHLEIFKLGHKNNLIECYKNIWGLRGFSYENSSIWTISHLFWAFSHLCFTPRNFQSGPWKLPNRVLIEYVRFEWVFLWKFLYINDFTPFLGVFTPLRGHP